MGWALLRLLQAACVSGAAPCGVHELPNLDMAPDFLIVFNAHKMTDINHKKMMSEGRDHTKPDENGIKKHFTRHGSLLQNVYKYSSIVEILGLFLLAHIKFQKLLKISKLMCVSHVTCSRRYWLHKGKRWELSLVPHRKLGGM
jgi:hypothetical protein